MKYAITGHSSGIGQHLYNMLSPNIVGFSRSNRYDLSSQHTRNKIISEIADVDIFINNAAAGIYQTYMFLDLVRAWKSSNKTIINVGSNITNILLSVKSFNLLNYQAEKIILKEMSSIINSDVTCNIKYCEFSYVGTTKILAKYPHFTVDDYISIDEACNIILKEGTNV